MTPERWRQVRSLFEEALTREPGLRAAFLREAAGTDDELRREVESLLAALERADDRFERPAAERLTPAAPPDMNGRRIGPYRLVREVGRGGMGTVYEAVRDDDEFHKRVAIKLIKRGMDTDQVVRRFRQERQILAGLEHPNIAALLDGGATDDGQPYFVLEYVEGSSVTEYCARHRLPVRERLRLFLRICDPVRYAHQNLVVHRDLKPSNILVTADGTVKLLDFGVAKLLHADDTGATLTRAEHQAFTPEYASPEQIRGEPISTAADIYSLGVLLYELLTGQRPFRLEHRSLPEVARIVGEQQPTRPSANVSAAMASQTDDTAPRLRRELAGELDSIVLMAIAKEPGQRYSSAEALAADVSRFLEGLPVLARRGTAAYRARKFVGRHRASVATAALVLASVAVGGVTTVLQWQRAEAERELAEARFRDVRTLANSLLFEVHDAIAALPGATAARALLVERSLVYLDRLYRQAGDDPELEHEIAEAYLKLGSVQGDPNHPNLGDLAGARASLDRALELAQRLVRRDPRDLEARHTLAFAHEKRGDVEAWTGNVEGGVEHLRQALAGRRFVAEAQPAELAAQLRLAISQLKLGDLLGHPGFPNLGDRSGAVAQYDLALDRLRGLAPEHAEQQAVRRYLGLLHERRGRMLETGGRYDEALRELEHSRQIRERLAREAHADSHIIRDAGIARERLCSVHLGRGDTGAALAHCEAAVEVYRRLQAADPQDSEARTTTALGERWQARALAAHGDLAAALERIEHSTRLLQELVELDAENAHLRRHVARGQLHTSLILARLADSLPAGRAREHRRRAADLQEAGRTQLTRLAGGGALSELDRGLIEEAGARLAGPAPAER